MHVVKRKACLTATIVVTLLSSSARVAGADPQRGQVLYETHCGTCHYPKLHTREKSVIKSYAALKEDVVKWAAQTPRRFTSEELDDIAEYLSQSHYRVAR